MLYDRFATSRTSTRPCVVAYVVVVRCFSFLAFGSFLSPPLLLYVSLCSQILLHTHQHTTFGHDGRCCITQATFGTKPACSARDCALVLHRQTIWFCLPPSLMIDDEFVVVG